MEGATGQRLKVRVGTTVNPLVFTIRLDFSEPIAGKNMLLVWNLFQMYASKNETVPKGKAAIGNRSLLTEVVVKRRLGPPRNKHPLERP